MLMVKLPARKWIVSILIAVLTLGIFAAVYNYTLPRPIELRILHTHPGATTDAMVDEVVNGFKKWYQGIYGQAIRVEVIRTDPQTAYRKAVVILRPDAEIWWGGLLSLLEKAYEGLLPYNSTYKGGINATSYPLMDLHDSTPQWYAASLTGIGVMYNEQALQRLNLSAPKRWIDLLEEGYEGKIAMVDPAKSELTSPLISTMIQSKNWTGGWEYLVRLSALIGRYDENEVESTLKVASGFMPLAVIPDFYAYDKITVYPPGIDFTYLDAAIVQPDPVAIIKRGRYLDEAKAFMDFILSQEGQNIIGRYRLPIRGDVTPSHPRINPFAPDFPHIQSYNKTLEEIIKNYYQVWISERRGQIKDAWKEIKEANRTKHLNENATHLYDLAWSNFTYAGYNMTSDQLDKVYTDTKSWTEDMDSYLSKWRTASENAYSDAIQNARKSKEAAKE